MKNCGFGIDLDDILSIRDDLGAVVKPVSIVTRTWTGAEPGDGTATDVVERVLPSPQILDFSHSLRLVEGGHVRQGDLILKGFSKPRWSENDLRLKPVERNVEKFFLVGDALYEPISVTEKLLMFNVQVRRTSDQRRYDGDGCSGCEAE